SSYRVIIFITCTIHRLIQLLIIPIISYYTMSGRRRSGIYRCMSWSGTGRSIVKMVVLAIKTLINQPLETPFFIMIPKSGEVIISHLVYYYTYHQFWGIP